VSRATVATRPKTADAKALADLMALLAGYQRKMTICANWQGRAAIGRFQEAIQF
jgi:phosphotransferase system HPr-like phosphotransfer protein